MATSVDICNLALGVIGGRATITSLSDVHREAEVCNLWYEPAKQAVLASAPWPACHAVAALTLRQERDPDVAWAVGAPYPGWRFSYEAPANMLRPRCLSTYQRFELVITNPGNKTIETNMEDAILHYNRNQANVDLWDAELKMAIVYALAAHISLPLQGKPQRAQALTERANQLIMLARVGISESDDTLQDNLPDWISARGYGFTPSTRFIYPYGPLISLTDGVPVT